jgi:hypothetical protein
MLQCTHFGVVKDEILWFNTIRVKIGYSTANNPGCSGNKN